MNVLHVVPGLEEVGNGIAVAAKLIADNQRKAGHTVDLVDTKAFVASACVTSRSEIWVHSMWLPETIKACRLVLKAGVPLVRMTHANLDPMRLRSKGWKKRPVWWFVERRLMNRSVRVVATCAAEAEWNRAAGVTAPCETIDLKPFFRLPPADGAVCGQRSATGPLHVLYLGRRHPLKGVGYLERAVQDINGERGVQRTERGDGAAVQLRIVNDHFGEELEADWAWADVLCLPTLSENFGLVVAEALQRGKRVVTTDGAPAWEGQPGVVYLKGYREGSEETRVGLLREALLRLRRGAA